MQAVIAIDKELYTRLFDSNKLDAADMLKVCAAVRKGKPLPEEYKTADLDKIDKIRAEIQSLRNCSCSCSDGIIDDIEDIIDKVRRCE